MASFFHSISALPFALKLGLILLAALVGFSLVRRTFKWTVKIGIVILALVAGYVLIRQYIH